MVKNKSDHTKKLLIVFVKNPIVGRVKSRLARTIGYKNAYEIYNDLVKKTHDIVSRISYPKSVAYSSYIDKDDLWESHLFGKTIQRGNDIGQRMFNAFNDAFKKGFDNIVVIGSDIIDLNTEIINESFKQLQQADVVIGPARDGGYYLIGLTNPIKEIFENKQWSTNKVFVQTLKDCFNLDLKTSFVTELSDLDRIEDFQYLKPEDWQKYIDIIEKDASKLTHPHLFHFIKQGA